MPSEEEPTFHDITSAADYLPSAEFPWPLLIALLTGLLMVAAMIMIVVLLIVKNKPKATVQATPVRNALQTLPALRSASAGETVQQSATALSSLLRDTLTHVTHAPALFQSQEEFHREEVQLSDPALMTHFKALLDELWELEYSAPQTNPQIMGPHYQNAEALLSHLNHHHS